MSNDTLPEVLRAPLAFVRDPRSSRFAPWAGGEIVAAPVDLDGATLGWLWWSDAERAAGWVTNHALDRDAAAVVAAWSAAWAGLAQAGVAPSVFPQAVRLTDASVSGVPAWDRAVTTTLVDLWDQAGRLREETPSLAASAMEALAGGRVSGPTLDAGLRGQIPMTPTMHEQVSTLDTVLTITPTPRELVLTRATSLAAWPGEPEALAGETFVEPAYFAVLLGDIALVGVPAVIHLTVPQGTPAMFMNPPGRPDLGMLTLARGLSWQVMKVSKAPSGTWLLNARIIPASEAGGPQDGRIG